jgi:hypothetical protein
MMTKQYKEQEKAGDVIPFRVMTVDMICDTCREGRHPEECTHTDPADIPPWQTEENRNTATLLIGGRSDLVGREMLGISCDALERAFDRDSVWRMIHGERVPHPEQPTNIIIGMDPNGGGSSNFSIISLIKDIGQPYVLVSHIL